MSKTLYEEAVADASRLRQLAEDTAKNKIVEAIMPQIRGMVNQRILGEQMEDLEDLEIPQIDPLEDDAPDVSHGGPLSSPDAVLDHGSEVEASTIVNIDASGDVNLEIEPGDTDEDEDILSSAMAETLMRLLDSPSDSQLQEKTSVLENRFNRFKSIVDNVDMKSLSKEQITRINESFILCVKEAVLLRRSAILIEQATQDDKFGLENRLTSIIKEMRNMSKSKNRNIFDFLFENEDVKETDKGLEEAELSLELSDDEREELAGAEDAEAVGDALDAILGDLEVSMEDEAAGDEPAAEEPEGDEGGEGGEDEGGDDAIDLGEADMDEMDEMYEIDETMLRRELMRLTEEAADEVDQFGGGEAPHGDVFVDVDEDDLINALADELGPASEPAVTAESRRTGRMRRQLRESQRDNRRLQSTVSNLKAQLVEMNLFNAKLLYANKLMQNKNLTVKQQKSIVEALDNAKTLREAKLLYRSLSESLVRVKRKNLSEGSLRTLGSSSRSTRSAKPNSNGNEADRWAVLAGLNS